jgi:hypothetical protein
LTHAHPVEQRTLDQLAEQLYAELLRLGFTEQDARSQVAAAVEMWTRNLNKPN